jgi:hypothetical protein
MTEFSQPFAFGLEEWFWIVGDTATGTLGLLNVLSFSTILGLLMYPSEVTYFC